MNEQEITLPAGTFLRGVGAFFANQILMKLTTSVALLAALYVFRTVEGFGLLMIIALGFAAGVINYRFRKTEAAQSGVIVSLGISSVWTALFIFGAI